MNVWRNRRRAFLFVVGWLVIAVWTAVPFAFAEEPAGEAPEHEIPRRRGQPPEQELPPRRRKPPGIICHAEQGNRRSGTYRARAGKTRRASLCRVSCSDFYGRRKEVCAPYGRIELDAIYSNQNDPNPFRPGQIQRVCHGSRYIERQAPRH